MLSLGNFTRAAFSRIYRVQKLNDELIPYAVGVHTTVGNRAGVINLFTGDTERL